MPFGPYLGEVELRYTLQIGSIRAEAFKGGGYVTQGSLILPTTP